MSVSHDEEFGENVVHQIEEVLIFRGMEVFGAWRRIGVGFGVEAIEPARV